MYPRWHILSGAILALLVWIAAPDLNFLYILLLFFSSFLMDVDHYFCSVAKTRKLGLFNAFNYNEKLVEEEKRKHKQGLKERSDFHLFHTIEAHILIGLLSLFWVGFFYVLLGMIFHSLLDLYCLLFLEKRLYVREYFFVFWISRRLKKTDKSFGKQDKSRNPQQEHRQGKNKRQQQDNRRSQINSA